MRVNPAVPRVLVAGHDSGGLNLLASLLHAWRDSGAIDAWFVGVPSVCREMAWRVPSLQIPDWSSELTEPLTADPLELERLFTDRVRDGAWQAALCATSAAAELERSLIRAVGAEGIPTVSFCDMWWAYRERFCHEGRWCIPSTVWVLDQRMARDIERLDWPERPAIEVVGSPFFEAIVSLGGNAPAEAAADRAIRFVSEPASSRFPAAHVDEFRLAETLIRVARAAGDPRRLVVRTHPSDSIELWRRFAWDHRADNVELDALPLEQCILDTEQAVGISSILLTHMALSGVATAALQLPDADPAYYCLPFANLSIARLESADALAVWLAEGRAAVSDGATTVDIGATARATASLTALAGSMSER